MRGIGREEWEAVGVTVGFEGVGFEFVGCICVGDLGVEEWEVDEEVNGIEEWVEEWVDEFKDEDCVFEDMVERLGWWLEENLGSRGFWR